MLNLLLGSYLDHTEAICFFFHQITEELNLTSSVIFFDQHRITVYQIKTVFSNGAVVSCYQKDHHPTRFGS